MGRKRILTDFQRDKRRKKCLREWREVNREKYNAYMREFNKKNDQAAYMREYRRRQRLRMFEDAFERVMDVKDGFINGPLINSKSIKRVRKKINNPRDQYFAQRKWQNKNRERVRSYCNEYYQKNKDKILKERAIYRELNLDKCRERSRNCNRKRRQAMK